MIYNYLKIAVRNLLKYKFISFINLFGLTVGLACCLLILTYILHELSYDRYHKNADRIYRVTRSFNNPETGAQSLNLGTVAPPFGPLLQNDFQEIEKMTRLFNAGTVVFKYEDKIFNQQNVYFADENIFSMFSVSIVKGDTKNALTEPFNILITEETAKKYFGNDDPINKLIKVNSQVSAKVTGVYKAFPANTHIHPDVLVSFNTLKNPAIYGEEALRTNWGNNSFFTYIQLPPHYDYKKMEARFPAFLDKYMGGHESAEFKPSQWTKLSLQKLTDIHLRSHTDLEAEENGDISRVYIFSAIGLFILLIACINYMNLSTARSALRAREIGVRKVVGARRKEIINQFLAESVLLCWLAIILAFVLTFFLLPLLNQVSGQQLSIDILNHGYVIVPVLMVPFAIGIVSGIYPALFMSSFKPVNVLKGLLKTGSSNISFRKVLVTTQFTISIILIISTGVVYRQMNYMQQKSLGYDREHILTLGNPDALNDKFETFRTELLSNSSVINAGRSSRIPTGRLLDANGAQTQKGDSMVPVSADIKYVSADKDFINTYGVKVLAGRGFAKDFGTDSSSFIINEAAVKVLGFASNEEAIGRSFTYGGRKGSLVGVINDFHFESMHQKIVPLVLLIPRSPEGYNRISVKVAGTNIPATISFIEKTWKKFLPETPYQFTFLDDNFNRLYQSEQRQGTLFTIFSVIAIFIACLGLFGLSAFSISQRIKEIGIRKVLGANISTIVTLLSKDYLKLVLVASLLAFPVAWYAMSNWLNDFAYRITMPWWVFMLAGIIAAAIALFTISFQAVKAAVNNPVKSLRTE